MADQFTLISGPIWKPVVGFEGLYEVSNAGDVRSLDRVINVVSHSRHDGKVLHIRKKLKGRILRPHAMVADGMHPDEARAFIARGPDFLCAHNADFDSKFLRGHDLPWLCTLQCSRQAWSGFPNYKNETIRQQLGITVGGDAHRAGYDSAVTARILIKLLGVMSIEQMVKVSKPSFQPIRMPFGKHAGKLFDEIPTSYLEWIGGSDLSEGIKAAARAAVSRTVIPKTPPLQPAELDPDAWRATIGKGL